MNEIITSVILFSFLFSSSILSQKCYDSTPEKKLSKISGSPSRTHFNINNISTWIYNNGDQDIQPDGNSGFEYPKGEDKYAVFESGLIWGGKIEDEIYVGGSTYSQGLLPGRVLPNGEREVGIAGDHVRIFRVRTDWQNGDLSSEINDEEATEAEIRSHYEKDWYEWPAEFGAPFNDIDNDRTYNPSVDVPGVSGAHQTIWYVANDLDTSTARSLYGSDPMGVELQVTIWGYNIPGHLENVMFKKYKLINKSDKDFTDMYFAQWSDIDLGAANNDNLGIDTLLNLMYGFNGDEFDDEYGYTPPAVGFQLLQGPIINAPGEIAYSEGKTIANFKNVNFTSLYFYICADQLWNDPNLGEYETGTLQMYAHMQGFHRDYSPIEIPDQLGGGTTKFPLSGNPITGEGWIDGIFIQPCDIKGVASTGPFNMAPGEAQEIVIAQLAAQGNNRLNSVALLKFYANILQNDYPNIVKDTSQISLRDKIPSIRENETSEYDIIELNIEQENSYEELSEAGYAFQGFNIYQSLAETNFNTAAHKILTYDIDDDVANIFGQTYDPSTGYIINDIIFKGTNSGIPKIVKISKDYISDSKLIKGKDYFFGITGYFYNKTENKVIESSLNLIKVTFQDDLPGAAYMDKVDEFQTNANSDVSIDIEIVDPSMLTGDNYEITFGEQHYYLANDGEWKETNYSDSIGKSLRKPNDQTPSTLIPLPSIYAPNGTLDLHFKVENNAPDFNYIDAISISFPENIIINDANNVHSNHDADPVIEGQTVIWKNPWDNSNSPSADGPFSGGEELIVNINYVDPTFTVDYVIYDDGWSEAYAATDSQYYKLGAGTVNGYGTVKLTGEVGHKFKQIKYWELTNTTTNELILDQQVMYSSYDYNWWRDTRWWKNNEEFAEKTILDGFSIELSGSFDPPIHFTSIELNDESPSTFTSYGSRENLDIQNYTIFGGVNSWAIDNFSVGTNDVEQLQQDYELRFTGVYDNGTNFYNQIVHKIVEGGSYATCFRMVNENALAQHPLNPNYGTAEPFLVRIPFEVWNVEDPDNQFQVNLAFRDRVRDGTENPFFAWNPNNRMYAIIVNSPYNPNQVIQVDDGPDEFNTQATWVLVFYGTNYAQGGDDVVKIHYNNPIELTDVYTFTAPEAPTNMIFPNKYEIFQNYPNPFNPNTKIRYSIPEEGRVKITIYNIIGQKVTEVINKTLKAGKYETEFNGSNFASGVYIYRIEVDSPSKANIYSQTKKMLLLK